jgi:hypothetical protein
MPSKHTIEEMRAIAAERGGECRSDVYTNTKTKLRWWCGNEKHEEWQADPHQILRGGWCPQCARERPRIHHSNNYTINRIVHNPALNENYFHDIATNEQAYWLGFLCADGTISSHKKARNPTQIAFTLSTKDEERITAFMQAIDYSGEKKYRDTSTSPVTGKVSHACGISFSSRTMVMDLARYGCVPRKSKILQFHPLPTRELNLAFLLGFFDGDGCLHILNGSRKCRPGSLHARVEKFMRGHLFTTPKILRLQFPNAKSKLLEQYCSDFNHRQKDSSYVRLGSPDICCGSRKFLEQIKDYFHLSTSIRTQHSHSTAAGHPTYGTTYVLGFSLSFLNEIVSF